jgi:hypothetical protein
MSHLVILLACAKSMGKAWARAAKGKRGTSGLGDAEYKDPAAYMAGELFSYIEFSIRGRIKLCEDVVVRDRKR